MASSTYNYTPHYNCVQSKVTESPSINVKACATFTYVDECKQTSPWTRSIYGSVQTLRTGSYLFSFLLHLPPMYASCIRFATCSNKRSYRESRNNEKKLVVAVALPSLVKMAHLYNLIQTSINSFTTFFLSFFFLFMESNEERYSG